MIFVSEKFFEDKPCRTCGRYYCVTDREPLDMGSRPLNERGSNNCRLCEKRLGYIRGDKMTRTWRLNRSVFTDFSTIGELYDHDGFKQCWTLEDTVRKFKIQGKTAIPAGTYEMVIAYSSRFERLLPRLIEVPFFTGIYIHSGNKAVDTEGCLLLGLQKASDSIFDSIKAMEQVYPEIKRLCENNKVFLQIDGGVGVQDWTKKDITSGDQV